jgi:hypothetical protein
MNSTLLITSFWDNDYELLRFFKNFYNDIWKKPDFLFICGYSSLDDKKIIKLFFNECGISFKRNRFKFFKYNDKFASKIRFYRSENYYLITYKTIQNKTAFQWDRLAKTILRLIFINKKLFDKYEFYITTANDDYFYVKDSKEYLKNYQDTPSEYEYFHTLEYIPNDKFNINDSFEFISHPYYFIHKAEKRFNNSNKHLLCRKINLKDKVLPEVHITVTNLSNSNCYNFEKNYLDFDQFDRVCFSIGCLDLNYLINSKSFLQAPNVSKGIEKYNYEISEIKDSFYKNYKLSTKEISESQIFNADKLKKYFS